MDELHLIAFLLFPKLRSSVVRLKLSDVDFGHNVMNAHLFVINDKFGHLAQFL